MTCSSWPVSCARNWSAIALATSLSTRKNVGQFAIKGLRPQVRISGALINCTFTRTLIAALLHASFQNVGYAKLLRDLAQIFSERSCNAASMCARSPSNRRSSISASESRPECYRQSRRWLCLRFGFQTAAPLCFFRNRNGPLFAVWLSNAWRCSAQKN